MNTGLESCGTGSRLLAIEGPISGYSPRMWATGRFGWNRPHSAETGGGARGDDDLGGERGSRFRSSPGAAEALGVRRHRDRPGDESTPSRARGLRGGPLVRGRFPLRPLVSQGIDGARARFDRAAERASLDHGDDDLHRALGGDRLLDGDDAMVLGARRLGGAQAPAEAKPSRRGADYEECTESVFPRYRVTARSTISST